MGGWVCRASFTDSSSGFGGRTGAACRMECNRQLLSVTGDEAWMSTSMLTFKLRYQAVHLPSRGFWGNRNGGLKMTGWFGSHALKRRINHSVIQMMCKIWSGGYRGK